jgi:uncharacterized protein YhaN
MKPAPALEPELMMAAPPLEEGRLGGYLLAAATEAERVEIERQVLTVLTVL